MMMVVVGVVYQPPSFSSEGSCLGLVEALVVVLRRRRGTIVLSCCLGKFGSSQRRVTFPDVKDGFSRLLSLSYLVVIEMHPCLR